MNYTTIEQSKKLLELGLSPESADMHYWPLPVDLPTTYSTAVVVEKPSKEDLPCWSLASLMNILSKKALEFDDDGSAGLSSWMGKWEVHMYNCPIKCSDNYENPINACMDIIEKLSKDGYLNKEV